MRGGWSAAGGPRSIVAPRQALLQVICNCSTGFRFVREGSMYRQFARGLCAGAIAAFVSFGGVWAAGDLSRQTPIEVTVELGKPGEHVFVPNRLTFETGKLYKLVLKNPSSDPH